MKEAQEPIRIKVNCTTEHLELSKGCGISSSGDKNDLSKGCWIAVACREIFPRCQVNCNNIHGDFWSIPHTGLAAMRIIEFDKCKTVEERMQLKPFSFDLEIPFETYEKILKENNFTTDQWEGIIKSTEHLELI